MSKKREWYQFQNKTEKSADILIYGPIGESFWDDDTVSASQFQKDIKALGDVETINLNINSPGGSVFDGNAIYNVLKAHKAKVHVKIDGLAASIASIIAMAGDTVEMPENAMLMIHDPMSWEAGNADAMRKMADALDKIKVGLVSSYHNKSDLENAEIEELMTAETWMTAQDALDYGFADEITEKIEIQACLNPFKFKNMPEKFINAGVSGKKQSMEVNTMTDKVKAPEITLDLIKSQYPEIADALREEGVKEGKVAEAARAKSVQDQMFPGHEDLINSLMWDGVTTGPEAAVKVMAAEKQIRATAAHDSASDAPDPVTDIVTDKDDGVDQSLPLEERCKAIWQKDKAIRAEFGDIETYIAYKEATDAGLVKFAGKREV